MHVIIRCSQYCTYENIITMIMVIVIITYCLISKKSYVNEAQIFDQQQEFDISCYMVNAAVGEVCQDICVLFFLLPGHGQW